MTTAGGLITAIPEPTPGESDRPRENKFRSILFLEPLTISGIDGQQAPDFFVDLNLDQIVDAITAGRDEYNLKPFFYAPLSRVGTVEYRYEILQDLESRGLLEDIRSFADEMRTMRSFLAQADKLYYKYQKEAWFLDAVDIYLGAVNRLAKDLTQSPLRSRGFLALCEFLTGDGAPLPTSHGEDLYKRIFYMAETAGAPVPVRA